MVVGTVARNALIACVWASQAS
jgi:hypothetical protein